MGNEHVILIDFNDPLPNETPEQHRERRIYEEINAIPRENKRYCYSVISDEIEYLTYQCKRVIRDCGFDFSIAVNSDNPLIYDCYYKPINAERIENDDQIKMFSIQYEELKLMANKYELRTVMGDDRRVPTGINSSTDFDMVDIMTSIYYPKQLLIKLNRLHKYRCLRNAIDFPEDFPLGDDSCGMLCGGREFDRSMTFQDPSVNTVFTMGAVFCTSNGEDTTNEARDAQRHGRMFGRFKQSYENFGITPLFITEKSVFGDILICEEEIDKMFENLMCSNPSVIYLFEQGFRLRIKAENIHGSNRRGVREQKRRIKNYIIDFNVETYSTIDEFEGDEEYHEVPNEVPNGEGEVSNGNGNPDDVPSGSSGSRETDDDDKSASEFNDESASEFNDESASEFNDESASESNDDEQNELTEKQTKVKVDINDEFKGKLGKHYLGNFKFVSKSLRLLKELEKAITISEFASKMREMGYNENRVKLVHNITNATKAYAGYWNYSLAGDGWIFMPNPIKDVLNAL
jgi:hypothetical protein